MKGDIPIDKTDNCIRMLNTGQYQTEHFKTKEDWWLIKYLRNKYTKSELSEKEIKDEIRNIWEPIYKTRFNKEEMASHDFYIDVYFQQAYGKCKNISLSQKYYPITIYQEELDYINSLPAPKWFREFIFIFLGHCKTIGSFTCKAAPIAEYMRYLTLSTNNRDAISSTIYDKLKTFGLWKETSRITTTDGRYGEPTQIINVSFDFCFPLFDTKTTAFVFYRQIDLLKRLDLITNTYICESCGEEFEIKNRTQRLICDECYKKQRQKRKNFARDQKRKTPL